MKYIMFEDFAGRQLPIIFPDRIDFLEFREQIPYSKVLSAGRVEQDGQEFCCSGESKGLKVAAQPGDGAVIAAAFAEKMEK